MPMRDVTPIPKARKKPTKKAKRYDTEYPTARWFALERAGGLCEARTKNCAGRADEAHHVHRRSQGGSDDASNLLAVCRNCHAWIHANVAAAKERGWLA